MAAALVGVLSQWPVAAAVAITDLLPLF
jgi:hypothetical protein